MVGELDRQKPQQESWATYQQPSIFPRKNDSPSDPLSLVPSLEGSGFLAILECGLAWSWEGNPNCCELLWTCHTMSKGRHFPVLLHALWLLYSLCPFFCWALDVGGWCRWPSYDRTLTVTQILDCSDYRCVPPHPVQWYVGFEICHLPPVVNIVGPSNMRHKAGS